MIAPEEGQEDKLCDILLKELGVKEPKAKKTGCEVKPSDSV